MIFSFSFSHLYFVYGFLFSCHDKRPPMIYYLIIEDLLNLYLNISRYESHRYAFEIHQYTQVIHP